MEVKDSTKLFSTYWKRKKKEEHHAPYSLHQNEMKYQVVFFSFFPLYACAVL